MPRAGTGSPFEHARPVVAGPSGLPIRSVQWWPRPSIVIVPRVDATRSASRVRTVAGTITRPPMSLTGSAVGTTVPLSGTTIAPVTIMIR